MELRNNNREVIRELAQANYRKNRGRNRVLTLAVALAAFMVFGAFSIARGKMEADYLLYARNGGSVASLSLEDGTEKQYEKIKTLDYVKNVACKMTLPSGRKTVCLCWAVRFSTIRHLKSCRNRPIQMSPAAIPKKKMRLCCPFAGWNSLGSMSPV